MGVYYHSEPTVSPLGEWWVRAVDAQVGAGQEVPSIDKAYVLALSTKTIMDINDSVTENIFHIYMYIISINLIVCL